MQLMYGPNRVADSVRSPHSIIHSFEPCKKLSYDPKVILAGDRHKRKCVCSLLGHLQIKQRVYNHVSSRKEKSISHLILGDNTALCMSMIAAIHWKLAFDCLDDSNTIVQFSLHLNFAENKQSIRIFNAVTVPGYYRGICRYAQGEN